LRSTALRLVTFEFDGQKRIGELEDNVVVDLNNANELYHSELADWTKSASRIFPQTMIDFLERGEDVKNYTSKLVEHVRGFLRGSSERLLRSKRVILNVSHVHVLPPVPVPPKIVCLGLNYRDHAEEAHAPVPDRPILFSKPSTAMAGPDDFVVYPKVSGQVDYEIELAVIIGKKGRDIPESSAFKHIGGYTIFNDISARDIQFADKQWFRGKSFDTFAPTGPYLVLSEQVADPHRLKMELRVNGEIRQSSTTANMIFKIPQLIAFISSVMTLEPGDIIATGTPAGVGFYAKPEKRLLKPGDLIEAEIEGLGVLRNRVVSAQ
jgi:2-keto-4-pentenoate hydratase/2-oxohepta-3-ene-1,7-dioic acid hydratase in catechol pathway